MSKCVVLASGLVVSPTSGEKQAHALVRSRQTCARPRTMAPERPSLSERARDESSFVESACARPRETRASSSSARISCIRSIVRIWGTDDADRA